MDSTNEACDKPEKCTGHDSHILLDDLALSFLYLLEVLHECARQPKGTTKMRVPVLCVIGIHGYNLCKRICYWKAVTKVRYSTQALQIFS